MWKPDERHHPHTQGGRQGIGLWSAKGSWQLRGDPVGVTGLGYLVPDRHLKEVWGLLARCWLWLLSVALREISWWTSTDWATPRNKPNHCWGTGVLQARNGRVPLKGLPHPTSLTTTTTSSSPLIPYLLALGHLGYIWKKPSSSLPQAFALLLPLSAFLSPFWSLLKCQLFTLKQHTGDYDQILFYLPHNPPKCNLCEILSAVLVCCGKKRACHIEAATQKYLLSEELNI